MAISITIPSFHVPDDLHPHGRRPKPVWRADGCVTLDTLPLLRRIVQSIHPDYTLLVWCDEHAHGLSAHLVQGFRQD